jgi:hypothetical protein
LFSDICLLRRALKLVSSLTLFHAAAEQLARSDPTFASLAQRLAALLGQTGGQGYPACDFTIGPDLGRDSQMQ